MRFQSLKSSANSTRADWDDTISYLQISKIPIQTHCLTGTVLFLQTSEQNIRLMVYCIGKQINLYESAYEKEREIESLEINTKLWDIIWWRGWIQYLFLHIDAWIVNKTPLSLHKILTSLCNYCLFAVLGNFIFVLIVSKSVS